MRKLFYLWLWIVIFSCTGCGEQKQEVGILGNIQDLESDTQSNIEGTEVINFENLPIIETEDCIINSEMESLAIEDSTITDESEPLDTDLVLIRKYIPDIFIDLKYATTDNFTETVIYENSDAYLRYGTLKKIMQVQEKLNQMGYSLLIWDAYRPVEAQFKLWEICPDATYVSDPNKGFSKHSRGNTVDITLVTLDGEAVEMPTGFDDFSKQADRDYSDVSENAAENSLMLEEFMENAGLKGYYGEWWHYSDVTEYEVVQ